MKNRNDGVHFSRYDTAEHLRTPEEIADYLEAVLEDYGDDSRIIVAALGDVARAQGMLRIAEETGLNREGLYKTLSGKGNPSFDTVLKVMRAVGVELRPKVVSRRKNGTDREEMRHSPLRSEPANANDTSTSKRKRA